LLLSPLLGYHFPSLPVRNKERENGPFPPSSPTIFLNRAGLSLFPPPSAQPVDTPFLSLHISPCFFLFLKENNALFLSPSSLQKRETNLPFAFKASSSPFSSPSLLKVDPPPSPPFLGRIRFRVGRAVSPQTPPFLFF